MVLKGKKIIVTGGAGFIGSHIVEELVNLGAKVCVIDNLSTGNLNNLSKVRDSIEFIKEDIANIDRLENLFKDAYAVIHQAAVVSVPKSVEDPIETNKINLSGTLSIFNIANKMKVDRVIYASSSAVYGDCDALPLIESANISPITPYAIHKYTNELYAKMFFSLFGLKTIGLRYFNVFGQRQNPDSEYSAVIPKFIKVMKSGDSPNIYGDGQNTRDFVYVKDVVSANILALLTDSGFGQSYNIGSGKSISINQLVETINNILNTKIKPKYLSARKGDIKDSFANINLAKEVLGYVPGIDFISGIQNTVKYINK